MNMVPVEYYFRIRLQEKKHGNDVPFVPSGRPGERNPCHLDPQRYFGAVYRSS
jgi:hypothetical protein